MHDSSHRSRALTVNNSHTVYALSMALAKILACYLSRIPWMERVQVQYSVYGITDQVFGLSISIAWQINLRL